MKKFFGALVLVLASVLGAYAQTDVRVSAGISSVNDVNGYLQQAEVRQSFASRFEFKDTASYSYNKSKSVVEIPNGKSGSFLVIKKSSANSFSNDAVLKARLVNFSSGNLYVGGGARVTKVENIDTALNPSVLVGASFDVTPKVNIEPEVEFNTPDVLSASNVRAATVRLTGTVELIRNSRYSSGIVVAGQLVSVRPDNKFFTGGIDRSLTGGLFVRF